MAMFKAMVEQMFQSAATAKGALVITPETVIVTTPGAENKKFCNGARGTGMRPVPAFHTRLKYLKLSCVWYTIS